MMAAQRPKSRFPRPPLPAVSVKPPFRAVAAGREPGAWREHIEDAMDDARAIGTGARVVSSDGTLLAKFENAARYATPHMRGPRSA